MLAKRAIGLVLLLAMVGCGGGSGGGGGDGTVTVAVVAPLDAGLTQFGRGIRNSVQLAVDQANDRHLLPGQADRGEGRRRLVRSRRRRAQRAAAARGSHRDRRGRHLQLRRGRRRRAAARRGGHRHDLAGKHQSHADAGPDPHHPVRQFANYFRLVANDAQQGGFLARYAAEDLGVETASVITDAKPVSQGLANDFRAAFTGAGGTIASFEVVPDGDTDYVPFAQRAAAAHPRLIFFGGEYDHAALETGRRRRRPHRAADGRRRHPGRRVYRRRRGDCRRRPRELGGAPIAQDPRGAAFLDAYAARAFAEPPSNFGPYAYDAANILLSVARDAFAGHGRVDAGVRAAVIAGVQATTDDLLAPLGGAVTGDIGFDAFGDTVNPVLTVYRVENGRWTPLVTKRAD